MLRVYLLRHGETIWNAQGQRYCGITDVPLTKRGLQQAQEAAEALKDVAFDAFYSSPFQRAYQTAKLIAGKQPVMIDDRLRETNFGDWEGLSLPEIQKQNPRLWEKWRQQPDSTPAGNNGETARQVVERAELFFKDMIRQHTNGNILVVAHNGVNRFYLANKLGMPLRNYRKIYQENAAISLFTLDEKGELDLLKLNG